MDGRGRAENGRNGLVTDVSGVGDACEPRLENGVGRGTVVEHSLFQLQKDSECGWPWKRWMVCPVTEASDVGDA